MKRNDIILILAILVASAGLFAFFSWRREPADTVQIFKDNNLCHELSLNEDKRINLDGKNVVVIEGGRAYMESADCPDQICVKQKPLTVGGRDIICLPNGVLLRVISGNSNVDGVTR